MPQSIDRDSLKLIAVTNSKKKRGSVVIRRLTNTTRRRDCEMQSYGRPRFHVGTPTVKVETLLRSTVDYVSNISECAKLGLIPLARDATEHA